MGDLAVGVYGRQTNWSTAPSAGMTSTQAAYGPAGGGTGAASMWEPLLHPLSDPRGAAIWISVISVAGLIALYHSLPKTRIGGVTV